MKLLPLRLSVILSLLAGALMTNAPSTTEWTDPTSSTKYDFATLKKDPK